MRYVAPDPQSLNTSLGMLNTTYTTGGDKRLKQRAIIDAVRKLTVLNKPIIGVVVFALENIYEEYNYLSPTRSKLYNALSTALNISARNTMTVNDKIDYLYQLWDAVLKEGQMDVTGTAYTHSSEFRDAILQTMVNIMKRGHPDLFNPKQPTPFYSYPVAIGYSLLSTFSSAQPPVAEVMSIECRDTFLTLPKTEITEGIQTKLQEIKDAYKFANSVEAAPPTHIM
jgi:hypothetical protein